MAKEAFNISFWFPDRLGSRAKKQIVYTVHSTRGKCLFEQGDYDGAITDFEKVRSLCSAPHSKQGLAQCLLYLGESYMKIEQKEKARSCLMQALEISKQIRKQDFVTRIEKLLANMQNQA